MISIKNDGKEGTDAKVKGMQPEILLAIFITDALLGKMFKKDLTLTSVIDSHKPPSLHPKGQAFDMRTGGITPTEKTRFKKELKNLLGDEYDVVIEKDHIHVEFDPPPQEVKSIPKHVEFDPSTRTNEATQALLGETYTEEDGIRSVEWDRRRKEVGEEEKMLMLRTIEIQVREILRLVERGEGG